MPATRRSYTPEYKREAVRLADALGSTTRAARDLGINDNLIHRWRRELTGSGPRAFPGNGFPRDEELARLKRENKRLQEELSIVKKAIGGTAAGPCVSSPSR